MLISVVILAASLAWPLTLEQVSVVPTHTIKYQQFDDRAWSPRELFYYGNESLVAVSITNHCLDVEVIAGQNAGSKFSRCFASLGESRSWAAYSDRGTLFIAVNHPGMALLEIDVTNRTIEQIFRQDHGRTIWGIDMMETDDEILVVMPAGVSLIDLDGHETWVGPQVHHPEKYFHHTAWATTSQGFLLNVDDGLRLYTEDQETVLVPGRFDRPEDARGSILGIVNLDTSWVVLMQYSLVDPAGKFLLYSSVVQLWDPERMQPDVSFMMPLGIFWNLTSLGEDAAVLWSHEEAQMFVITRDLDFYTLEVPVEISRSDDRVFGDSSDHFFFVNENGFADVRLEGIHN